MGVEGTLARRGSTRAFQGPRNGLVSMQRVWRAGRRQSQLGSTLSLLRRMLMVWSLSRSTRASGSVLMPVESAIKTRRFVSSARKTGRTLRGFAATLSSSRFSQMDKTGGRAPRKLAEISSARRLWAICGIIEDKKAGTALGVEDEPIKRWVVPVRCSTLDFGQTDEEAHLAGYGAG